MVGPIVVGILTPASRISSKATSIKSTSTIIGNGRTSLAAAIDTARSLGIISA
ncbi:hypothetical protein D3C81_2015510 [compost metagenome]